MDFLLPNEIKSFRYYERKLPLYLRNDECFLEHFQLWYELLCGKGDADVAINEFCGVSPTSDLLLYLMNIYDTDFLQTLKSLANAEEESKSDILDKLANLFGLRRNFSVKYITNTGATVTATLDLPDEIFLLVIKAQIIRNYADGSYKQVEDYYLDAGLEMIQVPDGNVPASVTVYMNQQQVEESDYAEELTHLFLAGYFTIEHLGIMYALAISDIYNILIWDSSFVWDKGVWGI